MNSSILIYQTEDGQTRIETQFENETVWLTQAQVGTLFQKSKSTISEHIKHIFEEGELKEDSVVRNFRTTASDGKGYDTAYYNLDVIISIGYRVKSLRGTQFRIWPTQKLKEYLVKGFVVNDERLKEAGGSNYFEELLSRIRDIRSSEKVFWRKILDIYAMSIDYDSRAESSREFFRTVQNKMHWAAHGHTAAEVIYQRVDAGKANMGLTHIKGSKPTLQEAETAKNYLNEQELNVLNRMVTAYLEVAELQALSRIPMYMNDWIGRLNDFLTMTGNSILKHGGTVSHDQAIARAELEYSKYKERVNNELSAVEQDFIKQMGTTEKALRRKK